MNISTTIDNRDKNIDILSKYIIQIELLLEVNDYYPNEIINPNEGYYDDPKYLERLSDVIANTIESIC